MLNPEYIGLLIAATIMFEIILIRVGVLKKILILLSK